MKIEMNQTTVAVGALVIGTVALAATLQAVQKRALPREVAAHRLPLRGPRVAKLPPARAEQIVQAANRRFAKGGELVERGDGALVLRAEATPPRLSKRPNPLEEGQANVGPCRARALRVRVMSRAEVQQLGREVAEIGQTYHFEVVEAVAVRRRGVRGLVLKIESPELNALREGYSLAPRSFRAFIHKRV